MFKRIGILALMLAGTGVAVLPSAAFAQDHYYAPRDSSYNSERDTYRYEARERSDRDADQRRERIDREHQVRGHEWRERDNRYDRYDGDYHPYAYYGSSK